ncbi:MAG: hypothetical protein AAGM22_03190 [Acidobacteriota bacterium]
MKKWTASTLPFLLVLWLALPAAGDDNRDRTSSAGPGVELGLDQIATWLLNLWLEFAPEPEPESADGDFPEAFIQGVGPYIVPVGQNAPEPARQDQLTHDAGAGAENP